MKCAVFMLLVMLSSTAFAETSKNSAKFYASITHAHSELSIEIPTELVEPSIKGYFSYLDDKSLSQAEVDLYLEMYVRNTVKLQYGAFPMALGGSKISRKGAITYVSMRLAGVPEEAKEMWVEINSFVSEPEQLNVLQISRNASKPQLVELTYTNRYTANVPL